MRYIAKPLTTGRTVTWHVYDRLLGSMPQHRPEPVGFVKQGLETEAEALTEARRLEELDPAPKKFR